jgi:hypothetical protein
MKYYQWWVLMRNNPQLDNIGSSTHTVTKWAEGGLWGEEWQRMAGRRNGDRPKWWLCRLGPRWVFFCSFHVLNNWSHTFFQFLELKLLLMMKTNMRWPAPKHHRETCQQANAGPWGIHPQHPMPHHAALLPLPPGPSWTNHRRWLSPPPAPSPMSNCSWGGSQVEWHGGNQNSTPDQCFYIIISCSMFVIYNKWK